MGNMPADPESSADVAVENDYDSFAEAYTVENDTSLINAYYTRPAIVDLAGDVAGRRILDAGCGSGAVSEALRERGAVVAGFDRSAKMVELARQRLGADTDLQRQRRVRHSRPRCGLLVDRGPGTADPPGAHWIRRWRNRPGGSGPPPGYRRRRAR